MTTAAMLLLVSNPTEGNGNALKKWVDEAKGNSISVLLQPSVPESGYNEIAVDKSIVLEQGYYFYRAEWSRHGWKDC